MVGHPQPKARHLRIKEQMINDEASGLLLILSVAPSGREYRIQLVGDYLPFGNRDFQFNQDGELVGRGTERQ